MNELLRETGSAGSNETECGMLSGSGEINECC